MHVIKMLIKITLSYRTVVDLVARFWMPSGQGCNYCPNILAMLPAG